MVVLLEKHFLPNHSLKWAIWVRFCASANHYDQGGFSPLRMRYRKRFLWSKSYNCFQKKWKCKLLRWKQQISTRLLPLTETMAFQFTVNWILTVLSDFLYDHFLFLPYLNHSWQLTTLLEASIALLTLFLLLILPSISHVSDYFMHWLLCLIQILEYFSISFKLGSKRIFIKIFP